MSRSWTRAVLTSVACDAHSWNLVYLQLLLEEHGCEVLNLGPCTAEQDVVSACRRSRPELLVVSSVNGHGAHDAGQLVTRLRADRVLDGTVAVVGGKLGLRGELSGSERNRLLDQGFDEVLGEDVEPLLELVDRVGSVGRQRASA